MPLTDLSFLQTGAQWPPPDEKPRLTRYRLNRQLWKGKHHDNPEWLNWWKLLREDSNTAIALVFNWHKRLSTLWADLLVGEPPRFLDGEEDAQGQFKDQAPSTEKPTTKEEAARPAADSTQAPSSTAKPSTKSPRQEALDRISGKDENGYVTVLYETAIDVSRYGDGVQRIKLEEEGVTIDAIPPAYWFQVVKPSDLRKTLFHVLAHEIEKDKKKYLWAEIHEKGRILYRAFEVKGNMLGDQIPIQFLEPDHKGDEITGVDDFLIVPFAGLKVSDEIHGVDDYEDLDTIIQAIEVRAGMINRALDKLTDPSMHGPPDQVSVNPNTGLPEFKMGGRYIEVDSAEDEDPPGYIVWDGDMDAQFQELEFLMEQLYIVAECTPAAFGMQKQGLAESGSALRRLMMAPLAKVARMTMRFDPAAKKALMLASQLEAANGRGTPVLEHIQIQWQDGLPADPMEQAQAEQVRTGNKPTSSQASAIRRVDGGTQEEAEAEQARIEEEAASQEKRALENAKAIAATKKPEDQLNRAA